MFLTYRFFFFNDTATTEIYTLSLHDALPISHHVRRLHDLQAAAVDVAVSLEGRLDVGRPPHELDQEAGWQLAQRLRDALRSEEHTSELQSRPHLVCRLLLEKKKMNLTDMRIC